MQDLFFTTPDKQSFIQDMEALGFTKPETDEEGTETGNTVLALQSSNHLLHYIGKHTITPGEYDEETGEELTAPVLSEYEIANLRICPRTKDVFGRRIPDQKKEAEMVAAITDQTFTHGTILVDPAPVTPVAQFAGGMNPATFPEPEPEEPESEETEEPEEQ